MLYIDHKYVNLLSNRLPRFKKLNDKTYTFRCPICGDSKRNTYKTRGYIFSKKDTMLYFCHNCGASMQFRTFLKQQDVQLYDEYVREKYTESNNSHQANTVDITKVVWPKYRIDSPLKTLKKISQLSHEHPAKNYVINRKIPNTYHHKLFYAPKFKKWINSYIPGKLNIETGDEPRLIIPFIDKKGQCFGVQGRSFFKKGIRYVTIMFEEDYPKIFGLDEVICDKTCYITEGPIDSMFIDNSIAMAGSDLALSKLDIELNDVCYIFDNEPRNSQIIKRMDKIIKRDYNIVIWPESLKFKDINDMILGGIDPMKIIKDNTFKGLEASMKLVQWSKA